MKTIWKFPLAITGEQSVEMPHGAQILCVQTHNKAPTIWAIVDPSLLPERRNFTIVGTGNDVPQGDLRHIGTVQTMRGLFVWHVFEKR